MSISRVVAIASVAVVAVFGLSACSGTSYSKEVAQGYFEAITAQDPAVVLSAKDFAAPSSNAEAYAIEQSAHQQATLDAGDVDTRKTTLLFEQDKVLACVEGYDDPDAKKDDYCATFSHLEIVDNKLVNFYAGDTSLDGRIALGDGESMPIGNIGSVKYISSYVTIAGDLSVILEITSAIDDLATPYDAVYVGSNGRQIEVTQRDGVDSLKSGRTGNVAYRFAGATLGGTLELTFNDSDWNDVPVTIVTK